MILTPIVHLTQPPYPSCPAHIRLRTSLIGQDGEVIGGGFVVAHARDPQAWPREYFIVGEVTFDATETALADHAEIDWSDIVTITVPLKVDGLIVRPGDVVGLSWPDGPILTVHGPPHTS